VAAARHIPELPCAAAVAVAELPLRLAHLLLLLALLRNSCKICCLVEIPCRSVDKA
jgi:hypothetical protein